MGDKKKIRSLEELRQAKRELKIKMALADKRAKEGFIYSSVNKFLGSIERNSEIRKTKLNNNISNSLNFISDKADDKFNFGDTTKKLISAFIIVAAPIISKKIQDYLDDYR